MKKTKLEISEIVANDKRRFNLYSTNKILTIVNAKYQKMIDFCKHYNLNIEDVEYSLKCGREYYYSFGIENFVTINEN